MKEGRKAINIRMGWGGRCKEAREFWDGSKYIGKEGRY